jgi:hypothetical protein
MSDSYSFGRIKLLKPLRFLLGLTLLAFFGACKRGEGDVLLADLPDQVDFNFHIKPILVQKCFLCHGPDPSSREANLRLDIFEGATAKLESGHAAIVPGKPGSSELLKRITHSNAEMRMPPAQMNQELTVSEIALLRQWIADGAVYEPHWAFVTPKRKESDVDSSLRITEGIDALISKKLQEKGLNPASKADKEVLIRRLSFVLTGLPPAVEQLEAFLADDRIDAYERLVDTFLVSQAYGERWARHWMDVVRYAETKGHEFDYVIQGAWRYRDYLIRALNADVPFDQLVREQLSGDLLATPRFHPETGHNESILGTLFYTMGEGTHSPVDTRKDESDRIDNIIDVTTKAFQGLTVSCAKCHDHKFDPIPTADYYGLYGILEGTRFSPVSAYSPAMAEKTLEETNRLKSYIRKELSEKWKGGAKDESDNKLPVHLTSINSPAQIPFSGVILGDFRGQELAGWKNDGWAFGPKTTLGKPVFHPHTKNIVHLESGKASSRYYNTGIFGALRSPNFVVDKNYIGVKAKGRRGTIRIVMDNFQLIQYPIYGGMSQTVDAEEWKELVFDIGQWKGHKAYIEVLPGTYRQHNYVQQQEDYIEVQYAIAFDQNWQEPPIKGMEANVHLQQVIEKWESQNNTPGEIVQLNEFLAKHRKFSQIGMLKDSLQKWEAMTQDVKDSVYFSGVTDGFKIESPVFLRGNHLELSPDAVPRSFLSGITGGSSAINSPGSGRMEMVEAILSPTNPLTSRVMVNRIWHHLFGRGIVETVDNFGLQGKLPTHPELLDYLALNFQESGWSIKHLIRSIVLTDAFQRAALPNGAEEEKDPDNLFLAGYPVRRLEAEAIRDALLAVAGNLDRTPYGPSVKVHLTNFMQGRGRPGNSGPLDGDGRRSIYMEVRRNFLPHVLQTFDFPTPFTTFGKRDVTNVPTQSLLMMNDPFVIHQAEVMAKNLLNYPDTNIESRIQRIYQLLFSRHPNTTELDSGLKFVQQNNQKLSLSEQSILAHTALWKEYCHALFNVKEFIYLM